MPRSPDRIFRSVAARYHSPHYRELSRYEKDSVVRTLAELEHDGVTTDELERVAEHAFLHLSTHERPKSVRRVVLAIDERLHGESEDEDAVDEVDREDAADEAVEDLRPPEDPDLSMDDYVAARERERRERDER
jgi:hypothetical protein